MKRQIPLQSLHDLQNAQSDDARVDALRAIKHELTGHLSRKTLFVNAGLIQTLALVLSPVGDSKDAESIYFQSAQLITVLAHGTTHP